MHGNFSNEATLSAVYNYHNDGPRNSSSRLLSSPLVSSPSPVSHAVQKYTAPRADRKRISKNSLKAVDTKQVPTDRLVDRPKAPKPDRNLNHHAAKRPRSFFI